MEHQHVVARAGRVVGAELRQRVMPGAGNALACMLVGLANVDQNGALADQFGSAVGRDGLKGRHGITKVPCCRLLLQGQ